MPYKQMNFSDLNNAYFFMKFWARIFLSTPYKLLTNVTFLHLGALSSLQVSLTEIPEIDRDWV